MATTISIERTAASHSGVASRGAALDLLVVIGGALLGAVGVGSVAIVDALVFNRASSPAEFSLTTAFHQAAASPITAYFAMIGAVLGAIFGICGALRE